MRDARGTSREALGAWRWPIACGASPFTSATKCSETRGEDKGTSRSQQFSLFPNWPHVPEGQRRGMSHPLTDDPFRGMSEDVQSEWPSETSWHEHLPRKLQPHTSPAF